jgi:PTS system cellobiose-specific IIA component
METTEYDSAFQIITLAGNSKSSSMLAIASARRGEFDEAKAHLALADDDLRAAHEAQTELITEEARGNRVPVNIILVHSQDHLTGAILMRDLADEFVSLYRELRSGGSKPTDV